MFSIIITIAYTLRNIIYLQDNEDVLLPVLSVVFIDPKYNSH
jgi:hypothetical protein